MMVPAEREVKVRSGFSKLNCWVLLKQDQQRYSTEVLFVRCYRGMVNKILTNGLFTP